MVGGGDRKISAVGIQQCGVTCRKKECWRVRTKTPSLTGLYERPLPNAEIVLAPRNHPVDYYQGDPVDADDSDEYDESAVAALVAGVVDAVGGFPAENAHRGVASGSRPVAWTAGRRELQTSAPTDRWRPERSLFGQ
ncbi:hypothetical protein PoB_007268300 [Plakobranchus ocellatus]|uniref:Uncharacterized protein n=1 Tax=Plakobranchus ocellatus TaxID=259542 RepID=A0AAV4DQ42_9GAST|nr:hypothetical protein PoB_007268300 [Plakobranchus ocellatus]